jgi:hypothetical protein
MIKKGPDFRIKFSFEKLLGHPEGLISRHPEFDRQIAIVLS